MRRASSKTDSGEAVEGVASVERNSSVLVFVAKDKGTFFNFYEVLLQPFKLK